MAGCATTALFGVVNKVALGVFVCVFTYYLYGVLVCTNCAVRSETIEHGLEQLFL